MRNCSICGHPNADEVEFCFKCAAALQPRCPGCGQLVPAGNKNEALPVVAASLLAPGEHVISNLPRIRDVRTLLEIVTGLGVSAAMRRVTGSSYALPSRRPGSSENPAGSISTTKPILRR